MEELMQAILRAPEERRAAALRVLRGEPGTDGRGQRSEVRRPESYVGLQEVAEFLGVSARSVWRWQVPGHKLGSRTRFRLSEVEAYVETKEFHQKIEELKGERDARAMKRQA
jgi:predicted DNA-binding transcriptional regulator AlpA